MSKSLRNRTSGSNLLSWPHLTRPSGAANEACEFLVDGRVKPGYDFNAASILALRRPQ